jgi:hypothetical protein
MSYTYLLEQGEEYSAASFSDIPPSVLSRLNLTAERSYCKDNETASCQDSQSGTMSLPSTGNLGVEKSMSSAEDSLAKTSQQQEKELGSQENEADFGQKCPESLAKYDPNTSSWRTHQCLLFEDSTECLEIFSRWGMMHDGELYPLQIATLHMKEKEFGLEVFYTPTARDWKGMSGKGFRERHGEKKNLANFLGGIPNPEFSEWLMGWPIGWTGLKPLEMDKFQSWLQQHSAFLARDDEMI